MFENSSQGAQDVIYFLDDMGVCKEMMYAEFEAVLDGVVGLDELAGQTVRSVFSIIQPGLIPDAFVFFLIDFDEAGEPPGLWNIPFHQLIQNTSSQPLGQHQVRLVTQSSCPPSWQGQGLWDPTDEIFEQVFKAIALNRLCLTANSPNYSQSLPINNLVPPPVNLPDTSIELSKLNTDLLAMTQKANGLAQQNSALLDQLHSHQEKAQRAVSKTKTLLQEKYQQKLKSFEHEFKAQYEKRFLHIQESAKDTQSVLAEKDQHLESKDRLLQDNEKMLAAKDQLLQEKEAVIQEQKESLEATTSTIESLEQTIKQLSDELAGFRKEKLRLMANGADKFFEQLQTSGLNFIAYHPGAGHVSVSVKQVGEYLDNPKVFAAQKIGLSVESYEHWLAHYESPTCQAPIIGGKTCGVKINRHEDPKDFTPGISDRCEKHRTGLSASGRIFSS